MQSANYDTTIWANKPAIGMLEGEYADALKLAATSTLGVFQFVVDHHAWELRQRMRTLGTSSESTYRKVRIAWA